MLILQEHPIFKSFMEKQPEKNRERNKDKSKQQFLNAVGKLLRMEGYTALKVNDIAAEAGLDKKLIYNYFGGTTQLLDEYILSQDYWSNVTSDSLPPEITDGGKEIAKQMLLAQFDFVAQNKELQKILLWRLSEERDSLRRLTDQQEANGEQLFSNVSDIYFGADATQYRAAMALLVSGIYYLNLYASVNGSVFCGIDLNQKEGQEEIKKALATLVDLIYSTRKEQS